MLWQTGDAPTFPSFTTQSQIETISSPKLFYLDCSGHIVQSERKYFVAQYTWEVEKHTWLTLREVQLFWAIIKQNTHISKFIVLPYLQFFPFHIFWQIFGHISRFTLSYFLIICWSYFQFLHISIFPVIFPNMFSAIFPDL